MVEMLALVHFTEDYVWNKSDPLGWIPCRVNSFSSGCSACFVSADGWEARKHFQQKFNAKPASNPSKVTHTVRTKVTVAGVNFIQMHSLNVSSLLNQKFGSLCRETQPHLSNHCTKRDKKQYGNNKAIACMPAAFRGISGGSGSHGRTCKAQHYDVS